jgi:hypothetical protein
LVVVQAVIGLTTITIVETLVGFNGPISWEDADLVEPE